MLGPEESNSHYGMDMLKTSPENTLGLLVDLLSPGFRAILFEKLADLKFKDLPHLDEGQSWVFQYTQDIGAVWSLYVAVITPVLPKGSKAKRSVVVKPFERRGDLFYQVDNNKNIIRRLDKSPFLAIRELKPKNYSTVLSSHILDKLKMS